MVSESNLMLIVAQLIFGICHREREHETHAWIAFGVITGLGLINAFITFLGQDIAWAGCTIFLFIAILLGTDKPVQVVVSSYSTFRLHHL